MHLQKVISKKSLVYQLYHLLEIDTNPDRQALRIRFILEELVLQQQPSL
jgi:hypothetical protein